MTPPPGPGAPAKRGGARTGTGPQNVGGGNLDFVAQTSPMSWAEGSFPRVTGVTSSTTYSLQMNSNMTLSASTPCAGSRTGSCRGWQQFIYSHGSSSLYMQYWLIDYGPSCPSGWNTHGDDCYQNSPSAVSLPTQSSPIWRT